MGSSSRGSNNSKMNKLVEYLEIIPEIQSQIDEAASKVEGTIETAKKIRDFGKQKLTGNQSIESDDNTSDSSENMTEEDKNMAGNKFIKYVGKIKNLQSKIEDTTSTIDETLEKAQKTSNFIYKKLRKSKKYRSLINKKLAVGAAKSAENMVNFTGRMMGKDLKKYAGAAKQLTEAGINKRFLGTISSKQAKRLKKNVIAKKILDKVDIKKLGRTYGKAKEWTDKAFTFTLDDVVQKSSSLIKKGTKQISNPKITKIIEKAADSKFIGSVKKVGNSKIVKGFTKAFSPVGTAMNIHTMMTEESDFKKVMAATDTVGDFTPIAPITSAVSLAGGAIYDLFDSKYMERFGGKKVTKLLDKGAGFVVKPVEKAIKTTQKAWGAVKKAGAAIKEKGFVNSLKSGMSLFRKKAPEPVKKVMKGYTDMYLHPIQTAKKTAAFIKTKTKPLISKAARQIQEIRNKSFAFIKSAKEKLLGARTKTNNSFDLKNRLSKPNSNLIDLYHSNHKNNKINNTKTFDNSRISNTRPLGNQKYNSNKNNFNININANGLSINEVANELASKIQLTMSNMYA